jgi:hypothetical protein
MSDRRIRVNVSATCGSMLESRVAVSGLPIYNGNFPDPEFQVMARVAVAAFNDAILRLALEKDLLAIDLRLVCALAEDYANPIEPSAIGGNSSEPGVAEQWLPPGRLAFTDATKWARFR